MNDFDALIAELAPLVKAQDADMDGKKKIEASAKEAGVTVPPGGDGNQDDPMKGDGAAGDPATLPPLKKDMDMDDGGDDDMMGKSMQVTMADGTVQDVFDASVMLKAMKVELDTLKAENAALKDAAAAVTTEMTKSLSVSTTLFGLVKGQGDLIKSLQADFARIAAAPAGRKAVISLHEKQDTGVVPPAKAATGADIMAKAMTAQAAGKLSAMTISRLEAHLNRGLPAPADIIEQIG